MLHATYLHMVGAMSPINTVERASHRIVSDCGKAPYIPPMVALGRHLALNL